MDVDDLFGSMRKLPKVHHPLIVDGKMTRSPMTTLESQGLGFTAGSKTELQFLKCCVLGPTHKF